MRWKLQTLWSLVAPLLLSMQAGATISSYTTVEDFETAAGATSYLIDDYSDWVGPGSESTDGVRTGYTVSSFYPLALEAGDFGDGALSVERFSTLTFTFDDPIYAFGFDGSRHNGYLEFGTPDTGSVYSYVGCCSGAEFHGVVFDPPATEVVVFVNSWMNPQFYVDNLRVVPEAGPMVMLIAGVAFAAMLGAGRRKS